MNVFRKCIILLGILLITATLTSCRKNYSNLDGMIWNTSYHISYNGNKELADSIYKVLSEVGASLNVFDESSLVSNVNRNDSVPVDKNFIYVYDMSKRINKISDGAFDPTLGPLIEAWGFGKGHSISSDTLRVDSLLALTGISKTQIKDGLLIKENPAIQFNFSAIAKGYACDKVAEMLSRNGVDSYLVEIGGEIRCGGDSPSGSEWRISIDKPIITESVVHESQCVITITDAGIATSGNYRNFHESDGKKFGHTISSKTGRPVQTNVLSATVVANTTAEADALATTMMSVGSSEGMKLADSLDVAVLLILADGKTIQNKLFEKLTTQ